MDNDGWIALHRKLINSRVFQNEGLLKVWIWCLCKATHKEMWIPIEIGKSTTEILLKPGQFIFGRKTAAQKLKMKLSTVWKRIKKLENMQNLNIQSNSHYSLITVVNWHEYQDYEKNSNRQSDNRGTTEEQPGNTNNNDNNVNKKDNQDFFSLIKSLKERYPDSDLIDRAYDAIRSTRPCLWSAAWAW